MYATGHPEHLRPAPPVPGRTPTPGRTPGRITRWAVPGAALVAGSALAGYLFLVDPNNPTSAYPKCILRGATGLDCPGCGGLRCVNALLHGDLRSAIDHNALAVLLLPIVAYVLVRWVLGYAGIRLPELRLPGWVAWAAPIALVVFTVVRNIPGTPLYGLNSTV